MANSQSQCKECGCKCNRCTSSNDHDVHLHVEIENLKQRLVERDNHIANLESNFLNDSNKISSGEEGSLREELVTWQDKYKRLYDAHRRVQRVNQGLEDKLLRLVDVCETEKTALTKDVATLSHRLAEANYTIKRLTEDNERYKDDVALAIQFLQCKQGNFVSQKLDSLPNEVQAKVSSYVASKRKQPEEKRTPPEVKSIKVPIPTFPPTAMVYSIPKADKPPEKEAEPSQSMDIVSAAIMAKVLEERERERACTKHCDTCTCAKTIKIVHDTPTHTIGTQTGDCKTSACLNCTGSLPQNAMKIIKTVDSAAKTKNVPIYTNKPKTGSTVSSMESDNSEALFLNDVITQEKATSFSSGSNTNLLLANVPDSLNESPDSFPEEKRDPEKSSAKKAENVKGPRYCSVRMQTGSKNILLDNIQHNVPPVLYTHPHVRKTKKDDINSKIVDVKLKDASPVNTQISTATVYNSSRTESCSSGHRKLSGVVDDVQNQQRVAEWIQNNQNNMEDGLAAKTNIFTHIDAAKYAEMESNVKKFLFGESQSEFLKKVALGKQNYQNLREGAAGSERTSRSNSHTETDI